LSDIQKLVSPLELSPPVVGFSNLIDDGDVVLGGCSRLAPNMGGMNKSRAAAASAHKK